jgi:DNA-binding winged helix-turn-helix (wHTH) protein
MKGSQVKNDTSTTVGSYLFDEFVFDLDSRALTFRDRAVGITPKAFQTLHVLLRDHGKVVDKERFLKDVWPDTFVEESTLAQNILTLRKALARFNKVTEFIVTVPRRGYRFVESVEEVPLRKDLRGELHRDGREVPRFGTHNAVWHT